MFFRICFPVTIAAVAVIMDLRTAKVDNGWILFSIVVGLLIRMLTENGNVFLKFMAGMIFPIVCLGVLFLFHMLGSGDIKLFCALGGIMGMENIAKCIFISFIFGACISFAILISSGNLYERFHYLFLYISKCIQTGKIEPYYRKGMGVSENFHFTIPVFMSVVLYAGGVY